MNNPNRNIYWMYDRVHMLDGSLQFRVAWADSAEEIIWCRDEDIAKEIVRNHNAVVKL